MCTAITYRTNDSYFGRNLDLEYSYSETVTVTPSNFPFRFRRVHSLNRHNALIGVAYVVDGYPLYYDAVNESGLAMAGLYFPGNAVYNKEIAGKDNITPFEFIPWILGQCSTVKEAKQLLKNINLLDSPFNEELPLTPLHWIIADKEKAITVEAVKEGIKIYDNPMGVLTNNPPFDFMTRYLAGFKSLSPYPPENTFFPEIELPSYSCGMGAIGLPGDFSSASRFVKASFVKLNAISGTSETESVNQFFHMLDSVAMPRGSVRLGGGKYDITVYSSCCNQDKGIYYYTTYENKQITAVDMFKEDLEDQKLKSYPLKKDTCFYRQNGV